MMWIALVCATVTHHSPALAQPMAYGQEREEPYFTAWERGEYATALDVLEQQMTKRPELEDSRVFRYILWRSDRAALCFELGQVDRAIADLEYVCDSNKEPVFLLRLARLYRYRGRMDDYRNVLSEFSAMTGYRPFYASHEHNILAIARLAEMNGENPKTLLTSVYKSLMDHRPDFAPGFIGAGDLANRKGNYEIASRYFQQALELELNNPVALIGLAECYFKSDDPRVNEPLERLLQINPHHTGAIAIQTEQHLDGGNAEEALGLIDPVLTANPNNLTFLSLRAAAYFLLDDLEAMRATQEQAMAFNPFCSEAFRTPGRVASRRYRFKEAAAFQQRALEIDKDDTKARALYANDLLRLGNETEGRVQLQKAFDADAYNVHVYNMLNLMDSLDEFEVIEQGPFLLQVPKEEKPFLAEDVLTLLGAAYEVLPEKYDVELETPVHIQIFDNHDDFMVRSLGLPGNTGFLGICFGQLLTMDSPSARPKHSMNWRSVLWHEFAHIITLQKTNNRMPRWLSEGISVYEEKQYAPSWGQKMQLQYKALLDFDDLPGPEGLEKLFTQPQTPDHLMLGYLLAGAFIQFYVEEFGHKSLSDALERIRTGENANDALALGAGQSTGSLASRFNGFLQEWLSPYGNLPAVEHAGGPATASDANGEELLSDMSPVSWLDAPSPFTDALRAAGEAMQEENWERAESEFTRGNL